MTEYAYDNDDNLVCETVTYYDEEQKEKIISTDTITYSYNNNLLTEKKEESKSGSALENVISQRTTYEYDKKGKLLYEWIDRGTEDYYAKKTYDKNGYLKYEDYFSISWRYISVYDDNGNLSTYTLCLHDGEFTAKLLSDRYKYDEKGNKTYSFSYNAESELTSSLVYENFYDENGKLMCVASHPTSEDEKKKVTIYTYKNVKTGQVIDGSYYVGGGVSTQQDVGKYIYQKRDDLIAMVENVMGEPVQYSYYDDLNNDGIYELYALGYTEKDDSTYMYNTNFYFADGNNVTKIDTFSTETNVDVVDAMIPCDINGIIALNIKIQDIYSVSNYYYTYVDKTLQSITAGFGLTFETNGMAFMKSYVWPYIYDKNNKKYRSYEDAWRIPVQISDNQIVECSVEEIKESKVKECENFDSAIEMAKNSIMERTYFNGVMECLSLEVHDAVPYEYLACGENLIYVNFELDATISPYYFLKCEDGSEIMSDNLGEANLFACAEFDASGNELRLLNVYFGKRNKGNQSEEQEDK